MLLSAAAHLQKKTNKLMALDLAHDLSLNAYDRHLDACAFLLLLLDLLFSTLCHMCSVSISQLYPWAAVASLGSGSLTWFTAPLAGRVGSLATALARTHHILHQPRQAKHCADNAAATASLSFSFSLCISSSLKHTRTLYKELEKNREWEMSNDLKF